MSRPPASPKSHRKRHSRCVLCEEWKPVRPGGDIVRHRKPSSAMGWCGGSDVSGFDEVVCTPAFAALLSEEWKLVIYLRQAEKPVATYEGFCEKLTAEVARTRGQIKRDAETALAMHRGNLDSATKTRNFMAQRLAKTREALAAARTRGEG